MAKPFHVSPLRLRSGHGFTFHVLGWLLALILALSPLAAHAHGPGPNIPFKAEPRVTVDGTIGDGEYAASFTDLDTGMWAYWQHDGKNLYIGLVSPGAGWAAIGFGPEGVKMDGANLLIGYVAPDGSVVLSDEYGQGYGHSADTRLGGADNILAKAGREAGGRTVLEFVFPLASGDAYDQAWQPGRTYGFILAYQTTAKDLTTIHSKRSQSLTVEVEPVEKVTGKAKTVDIVVSRRGFNDSHDLAVTVEQGDEVTLRFLYGDSDMATDNPHDMALEGYKLRSGVINKANPTAEVRFKADQAGTFRFYCAIPCVGMEHLLNGRLVVRPAAGAGVTTALRVGSGGLAEDGRLTAVAELRDAEGRPVPKARVAFALKTAFGVLDLGTATTDGQGVASLTFPVARVPEVMVQAEFAGAPGLEPARTTVTIPLGEFRPAPSPPGSLITPYPPLVPTALLALVVGGVWVIYGYVAYILYRIRKEGAKWRSP